MTEGQQYSPGFATRYSVSLGAPAAHDYPGGKKGRGLWSRPALYPPRRVLGKRHGRNRLLARSLSCLATDWHRKKEGTQHVHWWWRSRPYPGRCSSASHALEITKGPSRADSSSGLSNGTLPWRVALAYSSSSVAYLVPSRCPPEVITKPKRQLHLLREHPSS